MEAPKRIGKGMWIITVIVLVLVTQYLFDPLHTLVLRLERAEASMGLPVAREKWKSRKITDYSFDVRVFLPHLCFWNGNLEIRNGRVTRLEKITDPRFSEAWIFPPRNSPYFLCNHRNFTMENLLEYTGTYVKFISNISFDEQYGFISNVRFGDDGGRGLLGPRISDCCSGFQILKFRVLDK